MSLFVFEVKFTHTQTPMFSCKYISLFSWINLNGSCVHVFLDREVFALFSISYLTQPPSQPHLNPSGRDERWERAGNEGNGIEKYSHTFTAHGILTETYFQIQKVFFLFNK